MIIKNIEKCAKIKAAADVLELPEKANMTIIRKAYREMIHQWHPDKCKDDPHKCKEKTREVIEAYGIIVNYCNDYEYPFSEEGLKKTLSAEELMYQRFWDDPIWGMRPIDDD